MTQLTALYHPFLAECPEVLKCAYGHNAIALGLHGEIDKITLFENLLANFDFSPTGRQSSVPKLNWLWGTMAFVHTTPERVINAVSRYFYYNILRTNEAVKEVVETTDEDGDKTTQIVHDENLAKEMASFAAQKWMNEFVRIKSFIPATINHDAANYSVSDGKEPFYS